MLPGREAPEDNRSPIELALCEGRWDVGRPPDRGVSRVRDFKYPNSIQLRNQTHRYDGRPDESEGRSYYVTWTFEEPKAPKVAAGIIKDHLETLDPQKAFWKIEEGDIGGREHAHGLLEFNDEGTQKEVEIKRIWTRAFGGVDIKEYESGKGAAHYVGQYLKGKVSEWGLYPSEDLMSGGGQWGGG
jgi:hypothetical protein